MQYFFESLLQNVFVVNYCSATFRPQLSSIFRGSSQVYRRVSCINLRARQSTHRCTNVIESRTKIKILKPLKSF